MLIPEAPEDPGGAGGEEEQEVEQGHDGDDHAHPIEAQQAGEDGEGEEGQVDPGQPLGLHRDDEEEEEAQVGVQGGEGEEEGHVEVGDVHHRIGVIRAVDEGEDQAHHDIGRHADAVVEGEFRGAPFPLQHVADHIVHVEEQGQPDRSVPCGRDEDETDQPPDLPLQDTGGDEGQHGGAGIAGEHIQQIDHDVPDDHILHQVGDAQTGVLVAEPVEPSVDGAQGRGLLTFSV